MFKSKGKAPTGPAPSSYDYSRNLRDLTFHKYAHLRSLGLCGEVTALAVDPVGSWMAVGTNTGLVHILGSPAYQCTLYLTAHSANVVTNSRAAGSGRQQAGGGMIGVKFMTFHPGATRLVVIDTKDTLHTWFLGKDCMDDLRGTPMKEVVTSLYGEVTAIDTPSPAHSHLFLTMKDGTTLAFDLARRNLSPYKIPNAWAQHQDRLRRSGVPGKEIGGRTPMGTCVAMSPRDLNTLLIGYEGGVVVWDMKEKQATKHFEFLLPPGSPGGLSYTDPNIWSERTPTVTSIAWRPDGLVFAVGHDDGCIVIWALEDTDKPLMVRTITQEDVNVTDAESLFDAGALDDQTRKVDLHAVPVFLGGDGHEAAATVKAKRTAEPREPIYKLSWASFPDQAAITALMAAQGAEGAGEPLSNATLEYANRSETLLIVLGGTLPQNKPAINLLQMPPFTKPIANPLSALQEGMSLSTRTAFRDSLRVTGMTQYLTQTPTEDFVLLPRSNPYYGLAHDPIAIILFTTPDPTLPTPPPPNALRSVEAWTFPPPRSDTPPEESRKDFHTVTNEVQQVMQMTSAPTGPGNNYLSPTIGSPRSPSGWGFWSPAPASPNLQSYREGTAGKDKRVKPAKQLRLPSIFWTGSTSVLGSEIYALTNESFTKLIRYGIENYGREEKPRLPLRGGIAVPDLSSPNAADPLAIKMEKYRILATWSPDGAVRFWDISPHILTLPAPLRFEYPAPLPHLTISVSHILSHPSLVDLPLAKLYKTKPEMVRITGVEMSRTSLECLVRMASGEVFVYKFAEGKAAAAGDRDPTENYFNQQSPTENHFPSQGHFDEITRLGHLASTQADGFKPIMVLTTQQGAVLQTSLSEIGFFAASFAERSMVVVDLRGPDVILREGFSEEGRRVKKRKKGTQDLPSENTNCLVLKWTVCNVGNDATWAPRLIASYAKGLTKIFTLINILGEWVVDPKALTFTHESLTNPLASFVLDLATGSEMDATADHFATAMKQQQAGGRLAGGDQVIWIACSARGLRVQLNFTGDRLAKQEMEIEELTAAHIIVKNGNKVLACFTKTNSVLLFSLPMLEYINKIDLSLGPNQKPLGHIVMDEFSGDFLELVSPLEIHLRTLFNHRRPLPPRTDPFTTKHVISSPPIPLDAPVGVSSWIWGGAPMTGAQLDALIAGPNRPTVAKMLAASAPKKAPKPLITWSKSEAPVTWGKPAEKPEPPKVVAPPRQTRPPPSANAPISPRDPRERQDVYTQMTQAARQRGDMLDDLNERMGSVMESATDWLATTRNTAAKEAAKASAKTLFKTIT